MLRGWGGQRKAKEECLGMFVHGKIRCVFLLLHVNASCFVNCIAWGHRDPGAWTPRHLQSMFFFSALPFSVDPHRVSADPDPPSSTPRPPRPRLVRISGTLVPLRRRLCANEIAAPLLALVVKSSGGGEVANHASRTRNRDVWSFRQNVIPVENDDFLVGPLMRCCAFRLDAPVGLKDMTFVT